MALNPILNLFLETRNRTEQICAPLELEDYVPQPIYFASPPKWHLAHTTWFFEQFILKNKYPNYKDFHPDFGFLFNSYYNNVGQRTLRANRGNMTRPTVAQVYEYRKYVSQHVAELLEKNALLNDMLAIVTLGINHEQQHQELLLTDIKYTLGHNPLFPVYDANFNPESCNNEETGFAILDEGIYEIGFKGEGFSFDNEHSQHKVYCQKAEISKALTTNAEYIEFINAGGYSDFNLWLDEGWTWRNENKIESPLYWHFIDGAWWQYKYSGLKKVEENHILSHVSFYEAAAFAEWKGMRLPTEFEWEAAQSQFKWGQRWEWTNSAYLAYPGFKKPEGAVGEYNGKFMINQMVLRGASLLTANGHNRASYRNFFHPNFQWQMSGIRLAKK